MDILGAICGWIVWVSFLLFLAFKVTKCIRIHMAGCIWRRPPETRIWTGELGGLIEDGTYYFSGWPQTVFGIAILVGTWQMTWGRLLLPPVAFIGFFIIGRIARFLYVQFIFSRKPAS